MKLKSYGNNVTMEDTYIVSWLKNFVNSKIQIGKSKNLVENQRISSLKLKTHANNVTMEDTDIVSCQKKW